ncbi:uncharacterized protein [Rutidosis leptorrhynchoides]|uniref:uncharacterized protein isoform X1 n=1 Tax=Rutidosis leptorrhynchoides TaxID=125765 RepID=UPI003A9A36AA
MSFFFQYFMLLLGFLDADSIFIKLRTNIYYILCKVSIGSSALIGGDGWTSALSEVVAISKKFGPWSSTNTGCSQQEHYINEMKTQRTFDGSPTQGFPSILHLNINVLESVAFIYSGDMVLSTTATIISYIIGTTNGMMVLWDSLNLIPRGYLRNHSSRRSCRIQKFILPHGFQDAKVKSHLHRQSFIGQ